MNLFNDPKKEKAFQHLRQHSMALFIQDLIKEMIAYKKDNPKQSILLWIVLNEFISYEDIECHFGDIIQRKIVQDAYTEVFNMNLFNDPKKEKKFQLLRQQSMALFIQDLFKEMIAYKEDNPKDNPKKSIRIKQSIMIWIILNEFISYEGIECHFDDIIQRKIVQDAYTEVFNMLEDTLQHVSQEIYKNNLD